MFTYCDNKRAFADLMLY